MGAAEAEVDGMTDERDPRSSERLLELLTCEDCAIHEALRQLEVTERRLEQWLRPATALRQRDRDALHARLHAHDADQRQAAEAAAAASRIAQELVAAQREIDTLRQSRCWRITRPLRIVHRWLYRLPGHD
jgi:hypothetical protein